ncbi:MAG: phospholipase D-like domain-containing protein [Nitriliruptor sp.]
MAVSLERARRVLEGLLGIPATEGNIVERLRNGDAIFPAMIDAIAAAEHTVDLATFIYWQGDVAQAFARTMCDRARAGVRVRVILDSLGARHISEELLDQMSDAGVAIHHFRPTDNGEDLKRLGHRTHRKVLVVDEAIAFTGGVGIAEEWEGDARDETEWRDSHFRIRGPAVDGMRAAFVDDWLEAEDWPLTDHRDRFPVQPQDGTQVVQVIRGEAEHGWSDIAMLKLALLDLAEERVNITTAYFSPGPRLTERLCATARRGVEVTVLMPGEHSDKRLPQVVGELAYEDLLDAGVTIHRYERSMLHAKILTVDGQLANVGSANLNSRSLRHDEECDLVVFDPEITRELDEDFAEDLRSSRPVDRSDWEERGVMQRVQERVADAIDGFV